jgi:hypothetical protein
MTRVTASIARCVGTNLEPPDGKEVRDG